MSTLALSDYEDLDAAVGAGAVFMDAAQCHGILSGMLCVNSRLPVEEWLHEIFDYKINGLAERNRSLLVALFERTRSELDAFDFTFDLLLPDEDAPLSERAAALSGWCKGFLHGMGAWSEGTVCSEDGKEILKDIYQIAELDADDLSEEDEAAFAELSEFLRVGVQLLRTEFQPQAGGNSLH
ncbi:MAG: YecA family protein [Methylococcaceae bacterium]|nr:MAG: YecA family protein [Methylococcaceae bacterium]